MSINTFLIDDQRLAKSGNNKIIVGVKSGPASSVVQKYIPNSNSVSNTLFNINIPSENVLVDRHLLIEGTVQLRITVTPSAGAMRLDVVPAPFPFNQLLQSASMNINNSKVSVQTEDILNASLKQFEQKYLSKHCQGSANYVDKYLARFSDNVDNTNANAFGLASSAEKDSDTIGRGSNNLTMQLLAAGVPGPITSGHNVQVAGGANPVEYLCTINFVEPIFGLPTASLQENDGCYSGLTAIELSFQYTSFYKRAINYAFAGLGAVVVSAYTTDIIQNSSRAVLRYYSLHPSQYAKLSKKSVIPFDELVPYKTVEQIGSSILSNVLSLRQIPDKLYIFIRQKASDQTANWSNSTCFPITGVKINFNNVAGLLSEMNQNDLYLMSRRNGSQQVFNEFKGIIDGVPSIGSYVVIDVTRDLGLDDMLSASSLGQFSLQVSVTYDRIMGKPVVANENVELLILANYAGILMTESGSSSSMSGLLTKQAVLDCKAKGNSNIDYDDLTAVSGGNLYKRGMSEVGHLVKAERGRIAQALDGKVDGSVDAVASKAKNIAHDRLSKYM